MFVKLVTNEQLVMLVVLINSVIFIALDIDPSLPEQTGQWINWVDYFCVLFFVFELIAKLKVLGINNYIKDNWNKFDFLIVVASLPILIEPFLSSFFTFAWAPLFRLTRLIRLARFLRLSRILRYVQNIENLRKYQVPVYILLIIVASNIIIKISSIEYSWLETYELYYPSAIIFALTWLISRLANSIHTVFIIPYLEQYSEGGSEAAETIVITLVQIIIWALGTTIMVEIAGHNATTIIAGLGLGGMAVAFAAQDFVSNIIGGVLLYIQRPFEIGQKIHVAGTSGTVKKLGLRSITLEDFSGKVTALPNKLLVSQKIENLTVSHYSKESIALKLSLNNTSKELTAAADAIFSIAKKSEFVHADFTVSFGPMDQFAHNLIFDYYLDKDKLEQSEPTEELIELVTRENTKLYVNIISSLQDHHILFPTTAFEQC